MACPGGGFQPLTILLCPDDVHVLFSAGQYIHLLALYLMECGPVNQKPPPRISHSQRLAKSDTACIRGEKGG